MKIIFFGFGYCAEFLLQLIPTKWGKVGTHTKLPHNFKFKNFINIDRYIFTDFLIKKEKLFLNTTHILISIPPNSKGDIVYQELRDMIIKTKSIEWVGYLSSTGVYGDHKGKWVNEESKLNTKNLRSKNRIISELQYMKLFEENRIPVHIFRLPGIYGPNRSIFERIKKGNVKLIEKKNHYFSRIHVEDIATCLWTSMRKKSPGEIFNVTDDYPSSSNDVTLFAHKLLGKKNPNIIKWNNTDLNEMTKSFYRENKKVSNKKVKNLLGWKPQYSDYKVGLKSILKNNINYL